MIKEVSGDILLSKAQAVAHGIAPFDHFDNGLALSLRQEWPAMVKDFKHYCHLHSPKPGSAWVWTTASGQRIINLITQEPAAGNGHGHGGHAGRASESNVNHALHELRKIILAEEITSVALPRVATGVGGLDWETVKPLVQKHLGDLKTTDVYVYTTFVKGKEAAE